MGHFSMKIMPLPGSDLGANQQRMAEYLEIANSETLVIPLIETNEAVQDIGRILGVPGLEAIFLGPADLSASLGHTGRWEGDGVAETILSVRERAEAAGVAVGIIGRDLDEQALRREQGFRMIGVGSDTGFIAAAIKERMSRHCGLHYDHRGL